MDSNYFIEVSDISVCDWYEILVTVIHWNSNISNLIDILNCLLQLWQILKIKFNTQNFNWENPKKLLEYTLSEAIEYLFNI